MAIYNYLDYNGLQTYNTKIKNFIATSISAAISDNNTAKQDDINKGISAYDAWVAFLSGTYLNNPAPTLAEISTSLNSLSNNKANASNVYTKSEVYTKTETDSAIEDVKVSVANATTGNKVELTQSVDTTGRIITLAIDESGLTTALDGKVDKNGTDRLITAAEATKLGNIEAGAQVNAIETITITGGDANISATISNKAATIDLSSFATNTGLTNAVSTITSNITDITKANGTIDTKISTALGDLDYELTRTATITTNGTSYSVTVMSGIKQENGKITSTETDEIGNIDDAEIDKLF